MTRTLVKKLTASLALTVAIVGGSGSALAQKEVSRSQITTFGPPGEGTGSGQELAAVNLINEEGSLYRYCSEDD